MDRKKLDGMNTKDLIYSLRNKFASCRGVSRETVSHLNKVEEILTNCEKNSHANGNSECCTLNKHIARLYRAFLRDINKEVYQDFGLTGLIFINISYLSILIRNPVKNFRYLTGI